MKSIFFYFSIIPLLLVSHIFAWASIPEQSQVYFLGDRVLLVGKSAADLKISCEEINSYSLYIAKRNGSYIKLLDCAKPGFPLDEKALLELRDISYQSEMAYYRYDLSDGIKSEEIPLVAMDITNTLPKPLWERGKEFQVYDGICYNTALVGSGILSLQDFSRSHDNVQFFLSASHFRIDVDEKQKKITANAIFPDNEKMNLVKSRKTWMTRWKNKDKTVTDILSHIRENFSPGSIVCTPNQRIRDINWITDLAVKDVLKPKIPSEFSLDLELSQIPNEDYIFEGNSNAGGHCFTLITPEIALESNTNTSHNIVPTSKVLNRLAEENTHRKNPTYRFVAHYYQIDNEKVLEFSKNSEIFKEGSAYFELIKVFREIRRQFESLGNSKTWLVEFTNFSFNQDKKEKFVNFLVDTRNRIKNDRRFSSYGELLQSIRPVGYTGNQTHQSDLTNNIEQLKYWSLLEHDPVFNLLDSFFAILEQPWFVYATRTGS